MFAPAFTITRAVVVATPEGRVTFCDPSFAVEDIRVKGYVDPPSVERRMSTVEQFTGDTFVLATFQVMVWLEPAAHDKAVFGWVTTNGPAVPETVTTTSSCPLQPAPLKLSLAVTLKFNVRPTDGRTSQVGVVFAMIAGKFGK